MPSLTRSLPIRLAAAVAAIAALLIGGAVASGAGSSTVGARPTPKLGKTLAVDAKDRTLYALSGETAKHLKCTSTACLAAWPPLTVASRKTKLKAGKAVHGKLGVLHRKDGKWQVTLRGKPLYRFSGDSGPNDANGEGVKAFGGTWHAVVAGTAKAAAPAPSPSPAPAPSYY